MFNSAPGITGLDRAGTGLDSNSAPGITELDRAGTGLDSTVEELPVDKVLVTAVKTQPEVTAVPVEELVVVGIRLDVAEVPVEE